MIQHPMEDDGLGHFLTASRRAQVRQELLTNSAFFPVAAVLFELLASAAKAIPVRPDAFLMLLGAYLQARFLAARANRGRPWPLVGNLLGPAFFTGVELVLRGNAYAFRADHLAYWAFALAIGLAQELHLRVKSRRTRFGLLVAENMIRACTLLALYWIFQSMANPAYASPLVFFTTPGHLFVALAILLLGLMLGLANANARNYLLRLRESLADLRRYSEWLLGRDMLDRVVADPSVLGLQRRYRAVLFMDIRGFTAWSESRAPEQVVQLINAYFEAVETTLSEAGTLKMELTGDEILAVFHSPAEAARAAMAMRTAVGTLLEAEGMGAAIGINEGLLIEGLVGGRHFKKFAVLGDTVNTARRICDLAQPGEILMSEAAAVRVADNVRLHPVREATVKGKASKLRVFTLQELLPYAS